MFMKVLLYVKYYKSLGHFSPYNVALLKKKQYPLALVFDGGMAGRENEPPGTEAPVLTNSAFRGAQRRLSLHPPNCRHPLPNTPPWHWPPRPLIYYQDPIHLFPARVSYLRGHSRTSARERRESTRAVTSRNHDRSLRAAQWLASISWSLTSETWKSCAHDYTQTCTWMIFKNLISLSAMLKRNYG